MLTILIVNVLINKIINIFKVIILYKSIKKTIGLRLDIL